jgi:hypothetical protein
MLKLDKFISPVIAEQFPAIYKEDGPLFVDFTKAYFEWLETENNITNLSRSLGEIRDIDTSPSSFLDSFRYKYLQGIPRSILCCPRLLQKHIKELYSTKGTKAGLKLLFRVLFNEDADVYIPGDDILRASDGEWEIPRYIEINDSKFAPLLVGETITGRLSRARAFVTNYEKIYIGGRTSSSIPFNPLLSGGREITVLYLTNIEGDFKTTELVLSDVLSLENSPRITGSLNEVTITRSDLDFALAELVDIIDEEGNASGAQAVVESLVTVDGKVLFDVKNGGSGYSNTTTALAAGHAITKDNPGRAVQLIFIEKNNPELGGTGANFTIGELRNTFIINTCDNLVLSTAPMIFGAELVAAGNNYQVGDIVDIGEPVGGGPELVPIQDNPVYEIVFGEPRFLRAKIQVTGISGNTLSGPVSAVQVVSNGYYDDITGIDYTAVKTVSVNNPGTGYTNDDIVTLVGGTANTAAQFEVTQTSNTGEVISLTVVEPGEYTVNPDLLDVATTGGDGTGLTVDITLRDETVPYETIFDEDGSSGREDVEGLIVRLFGNRNTIGDARYFWSPKYDVEADTLLNANNTLNDVLNYGNLVVGTIADERAFPPGLVDVDPGEDYETDVTITVFNPVTAGSLTESTENPGEIVGFDADIEGKVGFGRGLINSVRLIDSGFGYRNNIPVILRSRLQPNKVAFGDCVVQRQGFGLGYWKSTKGFLNSNKFIHDNKYYQEYSYEVQSALAFSKYSELLQQIWHPAGVARFGRTVITDINDFDSQIVATEIEEIIEE